MTRDRVLCLNVLVVAVCALVYELLCGTLASYLLGDAVLQFSLVLGTYVFAMGVGAWLSGRLERSTLAPARLYVQSELLLAVIGGLSVPLLLVAVTAHLPLRPLLHATVFAVGVLVGLELPLLIRVLRTPSGEGPVTSFKDTVARAFAYDYVGALAASLLFPLLLVPYLGLVRTSIATGVVNVVAALGASFFVKVDRPVRLRVTGAVVLAVLGVAFVRGEPWVLAAAD